ncbi:MAG TPA: ADP-ribosylglycohydrolase family protein [Deltaproteobacteria bacterium]|jgi:ADP-ribosylglycohydrolase|nr:ADP-ribosylglycohydrolase family protein [Deltaproteobacteria bacterium]HOI07255.1 ADP-ribosylglycohydrolase family protein [Deltaproteobacteria bacterium]
MSEKAKGMVLGSFVGDSLALGVHLIFSTERIVRQYGRVEDLLQPQGNSYHKTKAKGDFTNCGDQAYVLLESLAVCRGFRLDDFSGRWFDVFSDYRGYVDHAMRGTLQNFALGKGPLESGSLSNDLSGASRIAPLVYCLRHDPDALFGASRLQTAMTHSNALTIEAGEFLARVCLMVLEGASPSDAVWQVTGEFFTDTHLSGWVKEGYASRDKGSVEAIVSFGQNAQVQESFPGVIHLIMKYEDDPAEALIQAVMAGGDSASRAMAVGMVLGAHSGPGAFPRKWLDGINRAKDIESLLARMG